MLTHTLASLFIEGIILYSAITFSLLVVKLRKNKIIPKKVMKQVYQKNIYKWLFTVIYNSQFIFIFLIYFSNIHIDKGNIYLLQLLTIIILFFIELVVYVRVVKNGIFFKQSLERKFVKKVFQIFYIVQFVFLLMPILN